jgi:hypothetical protein
MPVSEYFVSGLFEGGGGVGVDIKGQPGHSMEHNEVDTRPAAGERTQGLRVSSGRPWKKASSPLIFEGGRRL